jgi:polar amino acid transport system substrate-binding protein
MRIGKMHICHMKKMMKFNFTPSLGHALHIPSAVLTIVIMILVSFTSSVEAQVSNKSIASSANDVTGMMPDFIGPADIISKPDVRNLRRFLFLTTTDFPPFNFVDRQGRLTGFHVDLAREICRVADLGVRCQIQAKPFAELMDELEQGQADVLIAGHAPESFASDNPGVTFSQPYFRFPARFIQRLENQTDGERPSEGTRVAVIEGSPHAVFAGRFFPELELVKVSDSTALHLAISSAIVDTAFGDAMSLSFWLATDEGNKCCTFMDGTYYSDRHFGEGLSLATSSTQELNRSIVDYGLQRLRQEGKMQELYLRYFPIDMF